MAVGAPAAIAQDGDDGSEDTIVVIGKKFGSGKTQGTFELGVEDIETRPFGADITQSLNQIPGIQVATGDARGGVFSFELYLRGLTDEQIGLTIDGVPTGDSRTQGGGPPNRFLDSSNISNIVVSQSSGEIGAPSRFALGGFIDFSTADPTQEPEFTIEASGGSFDHQRYFARANFGEFLPGITGYASYSYSDTDVWAGGDRSNTRQHAAIKLVKDFEAGHRIALNGNWNDLIFNDFNIITQPLFLSNPRSDGAVGNFRGIPSLDQINSLQPFGPALGGFREDFMVWANTDWVLSENLTFEVNPYYQNGEGESNSLQDRARTIAGGDPRGVIGFDPVTGAAIRPAVTQTPGADRGNFGEPFDLRVTPRNRDRYGVTTELRYEQEDSILQGIRIGGWAEHSTANEDRNFFPLTDPASSIQIDRNNLAFVMYERDAEVDTQMVYGQVNLGFFDDRLNVDAGLQWINTNYEARSPLEFNTVIDFSRDSGLLPKVGASIQITDSLELFGAYSQNWAGIPEDTFLGATGGAAAITDDLQGLESENGDLGIRYVTENTAISLQGFSIDLDGLIGAVPLDPLATADAIILGNAAMQAVNLGGQTVKGVEVTGFHDFGPIDVYATYAYQDAEHDEESDPVLAQSLRQVGIIEGERVRDIPRSTFFGKVGWDATNNLRFEANVNYVGSRIGGHLITPGFCNPFFCFDSAGNPVDADDPLGIDTLDSYTTVGLLVQYDLDLLNGVSFQLNVDNLLDEEYLSSVSGATANLPEFGASGNFGGEDVRTRSNSLDRYFIGAPRTVTFSVRANF